eukprot:Seg3019.3 transcript_id=Seg3019.3/GoldUCD/mRNA.D3Y31 product="Methionine synthase reductase" protein_id=Seg3019.3/GoldUCD/D3Y31
MCTLQRMPEKGKFTILYGSQTGQAKAIAEEIHQRCTDHNLTASIFCLSLTEKKFCINEESCVVFVVSTTGDGEPPDTVRKFYRRINKKTLQNDYLKKLNFGFLALGDSNYTNFCNCGKSIEKRLLELGAKPFCASGYADDAVGLEVVVEPWIDGLWPMIWKHLGISPAHKGSEIDKENSKENIGKENAVCLIMENRSLSDDTENTLVKNIVNVSSPDESEATSEKKTIWSIPSQELDGKALKIPLCPPPFLEIQFNKKLEINLEDEPLHNNAPFQAAISDIKMARIIKAYKLTRDDAIKTALELEIDIRDLKVEYEPGDSFGIVCPNEKQHVEELLIRLGVMEKADVPFTLKILENTSKKDPALPCYITKTSTLRHIFTTCIDLKAVPKKALLRMLVDHTTDSEEKRRLQELCSGQGAKEYSKFIREPYTGVMDVLKAFPSCQPPVERLIELLPRLQPRAYSVSSSPLQNKHRARFVFNITIIKGLEGVTEDRTGLCTGWLDRLTSAIRCKKCGDCDGCKPVEFEDLGKELEKLKIGGDMIQVPVYWRRRTNFRLPEDDNVPIIMIGPGTGVAPFISFLSHREMQKKSDNSQEFGPTVLFYGCRHKERDFLYREKMENFVEKSVLTKLLVSFSRDEGQEESAPRYVQDNIKLHQDYIIPLIVEKGAIVYICGDAKNMARNVHQTFIDLLQSNQNMSQMEAMAYLKKLRDEKRYLEDIWT